MTEERKPKYVVRVRHKGADGDYCQIIRVYNNEYGNSFALFSVLIDRKADFDICFDEKEMC
jgi:hypothetical protein